MGDLNNLPDLLPVYYKRLFPFELYYKWLSYGTSDMFSRREFSFTLQDDLYIRFQSFKERKSLEMEIKRICPFKIDIGAVYNVAPKLQKMGLKLEPVERELIFDIDMTDYDEVRTCCSGADICTKCWKFMTVACKILDAALRDDFGFEHLLWVFSGRRGIHCWVCDKKSRTMNSQSRGAITSYLTLIKGGEFMKKKVKLPGKLHPSIKRSVDILEPYFIPICMEDQDMLGTDERIQQFVGILNDDLQPEVKELFSKYSNSVDRWNAFVEYHKRQLHSSNPKWRWQKNLIQEIMIQYIYPRLDINVTKGLNHLLKSPFCVHPKTGKVSIPFNAKKADDFDPNKVPMITALIEEVNAYDAQEELNQQKDLSVKTRIKDYKKTSLKTPIFVFQEFLQKLEAANRGAQIKQSDIKMEF